MSAVTTPTNVSLIQRDASGDNQWIDLLGSANPGKAIGFNDSGALTAISTFGIQYVKTWAQLQAALAAAGVAGGGTIFIDGTIIIPPNTVSPFGGAGGLNITVPNVVITGHANGKSVLKLQTGVTFTSQTYSVVNINANNVLIENITIEGTVVNVTVGGVSSQRNAIGIHFGGGVPVGGVSPGISDTTIRNVHIFNTFRAMWHSGGPGSPIQRNLSIVGNKIRTSGAGVYLEWSVDGVLISENSIVGDGAVYDGTKFSVENCIWVGEGIGNCRIVGNNCSDHQRMGIEVFWPFKNTIANNAQVSRGKNSASVVVANNTISNTGSMGISFAGARNSVVANNTIVDSVFCGLEIVGDDRNTQTQKPDRIVNALVIGNTVKNVRATPRRNKTTAPADPWLYGYSPIALDPTNCTLPSQSFSNRVPLTGTAQFGTGPHSFTFTTPRVYPEFAVNKQVLLSRSDGRFMIGTVTINNGVTITVNVTSLSGSPDGAFGTYTLCPYGLHTISIPSLNLEWSGNNFMQNSLPVATLEGTAILLRNPSTASADQYMNATVVSYTQGATTAVISIGDTGAAFDQNTSWIAMTAQMIVGLSIDQIFGCKAIGNTVDIVLDSSSSVKLGCQIQFCEDVTFEGNTIARGGQRYLFVNNSNRVFVRGNTFKAGTVSMVRDATNFNITVLGEDTVFPENIVSTNPQAWPCSLYAIFTSSSPGYNASLPYNNCRIIFKDNSVIPTANNALKTLTNGAAIFSDQYSRPESTFGPAVVLKNNWVGEGYTDVVNWPIPVLDYSQKWSNNGQNFTGYRFHIDTFQSGSSSRLFDIAAGDATYLYLRTWSSITSNTLVIGAPNKGFSVTVVQIIGGVPTRVPDPAFALAAVPVGTFVRCTALNSSNVVQGFIEGRVETYNAGTVAFSMLATYAEGTPGTYTNWSIQFDTSALFVDKASKLNLRSDVVLDYHTGTKIGTAATQKLGFWGKGAEVQPAAVADATDAGTTQTQLNALLARLRSVGIIAS
jgi:parallel beta-helix repeat protein